MITRYEGQQLIIIIQKQHTNDDHNIQLILKQEFADILHLSPTIHSDTYKSQFR